MFVRHAEPADYARVIDAVNERSVAFQRGEARVLLVKTLGFEP